MMISFPIFWTSKEQLILRTTDLTFFLVRAAAVFRFCQDSKVDAVVCKGVKHLVSLWLCVSNRSRQPSDVPRPELYFILLLFTTHYSLYQLYQSLVSGNHKRSRRTPEKLPAVDRSRHLAPTRVKMKTV